MKTENNNIRQNFTKFMENLLNLTKFMRNLRKQKITNSHKIFQKLTRIDKN